MEACFRHDPYNEYFRKPAGAVVKCTDVMLRAGFCADTGYEPVPVFVNIVFRFEKITGTFRIELKDDTVLLDMLDRAGVYYYHFTAESEGRILASSETFRITVTESKNTVPEWFRKAVIYQIFPDRFCIGDGPCEKKRNSFMYGSTEDEPMYIKDAEGNVVRWDFYGGNFSGIAAKTDYIRSLGADTVYLNPVFSSRSNHRYDTMDYMHADGLLGGDEGFHSLMQKCAEKGIKIILDGVFSHTGADSIYFDRYGRFGNGAYGNTASPYYSWYRFRDDGSYDCWWDVEDLPNVNETDPSYIRYIVTGEESVVKRWMAEGISGWRLDVADELPDEFLRTFYAGVKKENPDAVVFGEVWEDASDKVSYDTLRSYWTEKELDSCTGYVFRNNLIDFFSGSVSGTETLRSFRNLQFNYPEENFYSLVNMTGSHDVERLFSVFLRITKNDYRLSVGLLKVYSLIQFTFPGVPLIYYGDEDCMEGGKDPENRKFYRWDRRNTETEEWFSKMAEIRRENRALTDGRLELLECPGDENIFVFRRTLGTDSFITAADRFGRGRTHILNMLDFTDTTGYNIIIEADGYGLLMKKNITEVL